MTEDIDSLRALVQGSLPAQVRYALASYERFTAEEPPSDAKGFAAWHGAAKAALAHIEVLVKLVRWADGRADQALDGANGVDHLLAQARAALAGLGDDDGDVS